MPNESTVLKTTFPQKKGRIQPIFQFRFGRSPTTATRRWATQAISYQAFESAIMMRSMLARFTLSAAISVIIFQTT
jgi:hypothetical protein